jgi:hypothetical protein
MPQWIRDRTDDNSRYPDERYRAVCPREFVTLLLQFDHHVVWIAERPALLLTYRWAELPPEEQERDLSFEVSFTYAAGHPKAPLRVQKLIESFSFSPVTIMKAGAARS